MRVLEEFDLRAALAWIGDEARGDRVRELLLLNELVALALVEVDDAPVAQPFVGIAKLPMRTLIFLRAALREMNPDIAERLCAVIERREERTVRVSRRPTPSA